MERVKAGFAAEPASEERKQHDQLRLATAAVLLDIAYADDAFHPNETEDALQYLQRAFQLSEGDARELIEAADEIRNHTIDHFAVTHYIRRNTTLEQRIDLVKTLWRLAYSDGKLAEYEGYLVRKLADLLGLEHHVMIDAKVAVLREREGT